MRDVACGKRDAEKLSGIHLLILHPSSPIPHSSYLYRVKIDYLIVGQGIAGSTLAMTLYNRGKRVLIVSKDGLSSSSAVAAGIYNPFNFRKTTPTRFAREATPLAKTFYKALEAQLDSNFHTDKNIIRVFGSSLEYDQWSAYVSQNDSVFASRSTAPGEITEKLNAPFGTGIITGGGVINTAGYIYAVKKFFADRNLYRDEKFTGNLEFSEEEVLYNGEITAQKVIFCDGHLASFNKYYPRLSIAPTKGETLHVFIPELKSNDVINGPVYLSPLGNDLYDCGATFNPGKADEEVTETGRDELISKLQKMICVTFRAESQFSGVRPAGRDRKPVIGVSREERKIAFFNGFGSKAVLLSPFLAQMLADHLESGTEILPEVSISRFKVY